MKPLRFIPYYKSVIWGGVGIGVYKGEVLPGDNVGESWELSGYPEQLSIVAEGDFAGKSIIEVIELCGEKLLGRHVLERFGNSFPLILKIIDAHQDLSVQVHPDDARAQGFGADRGKTEFWYTLALKPGSVIYAGLSQDSDADEVRRRVKEGTLDRIVNRYNNHAGDSFYLPAGEIHAIGEGNLLLEIQQASDVTFRLFDYNRRDRYGKLRQLHLEEALSVMSFKGTDGLRVVERVEIEPGHNRLCDCSYFKMSEMIVDGERVYKNIDDSFAIIFCVSGEICITDDDGNREGMLQGQTLLYPASSERLVVNGSGKLLIITA